MKYFLPFLYSICSRMGHPFYKASALITFLIPLLVVILFYEPLPLVVLPRFLLALIALYSIYELGYLFNDICTTAFEEDPTFRLSPQERAQIHRFIHLHVALRNTVLLFSVLALQRLQVENLQVFVLLLFFLQLIFALHNSFRGRITLGTFFLLHVLKYISIPVLFIPLSQLGFPLLFLIFLFPFIRALEFATWERFGFIRFRGVDVDRLRVVYHSLLLLFSGLLFLRNPEYLVALVLAFYLLLFRIISYGASRRKAIQSLRPREYSAGNS